VFREQRTFGKSRYPFRSPARGRRLRPCEVPGVYSGLERILVLPWNENYTDEHVRYIGSSIIDAVKKLAR